MKKKIKGRGYSLFLNINLFRKMKLIALFVLIAIFQLTAIESSAQSTKINLSLKNATLKEAIKAIESQSEFIFFYSNEEIDMNQKVNLSVKDKEINQVLNLLLPNYSFQIEKNRVALTPKDEQDKVGLTGIVLDKNKEPVIGANVFIKGTTQGVVTDFDGKFALSAPIHATLVVSYIGFLSKEVIIRNSAPLSIQLIEDSQNLDEIVVVGYGRQKKVNLTGAVASVSQDKIDSRPITSISSGLQGLLSGVTIVQPSGQPGADNGTIRIRGVGTLNNANPMIIVDGIEVSMNNLDPNDIESISVLKDAASAAIYGSRAANGVILVTTKRGKEGKATISYSGNFGWQAPTSLPEQLNSAEYAELTNEALQNDGKPKQFTDEEIQKFRDGSDPDNYADTDWAKLFYIGSGFQQTHNLNVSGGTNAVRYMASLGYQQQDGIILNSGKKRYNMRINMDADLTSRLQAKFSIAFSKSEVISPTNPYTKEQSQIFRQIIRISPWVPNKKTNGDYGRISDGNPIAWMDAKATANSNEYLFTGLGSVSYKILDELSVRAEGSYKMFLDETNMFVKEVIYSPTDKQGPNEAKQTFALDNRTAGDLILDYKKEFNKHSLSGLLGFHSELYQYRKNLASRTNLPNNDISDINAGSVEDQKTEGVTKALAMMSTFMRVSYDYAGKYLAEANIRYDGTSRFAKTNRWGAFPSVSVGWRISEEQFMQSTHSFMDNLKVRGSWGMLGNENIDDYYPTIPIISTGQSYPIGDLFKMGGAVLNAKNPNLKWEAVTSWDIGIDASFFNKLNVTLDYYNKITSDILMVIPSPETYALNNFFDNVGELSNNGFEFTMQYTQPINKVMLSVGGNMAINRNKILKLASENDILPTGEARFIKRVGESINSVFGYETAGLFQNQAEIDTWAKDKITGYIQRPGDLKYVDQNDDHIIDANDRVVLGTTDPKFTYGFNVGLKYKGFDLSLFFQGAAGVKSYLSNEAIGSFNGTDGHPSTLWKDRWTPENPNTTVPRVIRGIRGPSMNTNVTSSYWLQKGDYLRLKNIQIGYDFSGKTLKRLGIAKLRPYYSGQNILTFTRFLKGWDPESPTGNGFHYPQVMTNSFGVNVVF